MQILDLIHGTRTLQVDLAGMPFLSRLGPNEGTMTITCDARGRVIDLQVSQVSPRRILLRELERIATEADWDVPVATILTSAAPRFVVELELGPEGKQRLAEVDVLIAGESLPRIGRMLRPLLKDKHFRVQSIREVWAFEKA